MNKSILKKLPALLAILVVAGGVQTFTSCSSDDEGGGDGSSSSGGGSPSSSSLQTQGGGSSSSAVQCLDADSGTFTDDRDNKEYRYVTICSQTWMAENLNYDVEGSRCYDDLDSNCDIYGRLYDWIMVMGFDASCRESDRCTINRPHQGACPSGWHIPSDGEWVVLYDYAGGQATAGTKLKATSGWNDYKEKSGNGTDDYGFSALPGGSGNWSTLVGGSFFRNIGEEGYWQSTLTRGDGRTIWVQGMFYNVEDAGAVSKYKSLLMSVRCVKDQKTETEEI